MATFNSSEFNLPAVSGKYYPGVIEVRRTVNLSNLISGTYTLTSGDKIRFFKLPPNARLSYAHLRWSGLDDGTPTITFTLNVTDGTTSHDLLGTQNTGSGVKDTRNLDGVSATSSKVGQTFTGDDWYVELSVTATSSAAHSSGYVEVILGYIENF